MCKNVPEPDGVAQALGEFSLDESFVFERCDSRLAAVGNVAALLFAEFRCNIDYRLGEFFELPFDRIASVLFAGSRVFVPR